MEAITDYSSLLEKLNELPPPRKGMTRVYRGQNRDFGKMVSSAYRGRWSDYADHWQRSAMVMAQEYVDPGDDGVNLRLLAHWLHAISQHYGGVSTYLDVTRDLDTALWFALHQLKSVEVSGPIGPAGKLDQATDFDVKQTFVHYQQFQDAPGWLYVFDAPLWNGTDFVLEHGTLVDVARQAPGLVGASTRMSAQKACFLHAQASPDSPNADLKSVYVCEPLRVAWPLTGVSGLDRRTEDLFPGLSEDSWYRKFFTLPLTPRWDAEEEEVRFAHPIDVMLIWPGESEEQLVEVARSTNMISPVVAYHLFDELADRNGDACADWARRFDPRQALRIQLEAPLLSLSPAKDADTWNHALLLEELPEETNVYAYDRSRILTTASLDNVIIEFNPIELLGWDTAEPRGDCLPRAIWLTRDGERLEASVFVQGLRRRSVMIPFVQVELDGGDRELKYRREDDSLGPLSDLPALERMLLVAMLVLNEVSPKSRLQAFSRLSQQRGDTWIHDVAAYENAVLLCRLPAPIVGEVVNVLRLPDGLVFCGPKKPLWTKTIEASQPYGRIEPALLREALRRLPTESSLSGRSATRAHRTGQDPALVAPEAPDVT